jgi:hypothetical protein
MFILVIFYSLLALSGYLLIITIKCILDKNWKNFAIFVLVLFCCLAYTRMIHYRVFWTDTFSDFKQDFEVSVRSYYNYYNKPPTINEIQKSPWLKEYLYIFSFMGNPNLDVNYSSCQDSFYVTIYSYGYDKDNDSLKTLLKGSNSEILNPFSDGDLIVTKIGFASKDSCKNNP